MATKAEKAEYAREWRAAHRETVNARRKELRSQNPEQLKAQQAKDYRNRRDKHGYTMKEYNHWWHLKRNHNLSQAEFEAMWESQQGRCLICGESMTPWQDYRPANRKAVNVDHCHAQGHIRGLLCNGCNLGLMFYEKYRAQIDSYLMA